MYDLEYGEKTKKCVKWYTHSVGTGIWRENWHTRKMRNSHGRAWNMARNTEKRVKWETHSVGHGIRQETVKHDKYEKYTL